MRGSQDAFVRLLEGSWAELTLILHELSVVMVPVLCTVR